MNWLQTPIFRIISFVVLFFFAWSFGGIIDIAYAVKNSSESGVRNSEFKKQQRPEEKFNNSLDDIGQILADTTKDTDTKKR